MRACVCVCVCMCVCVHVAAVSSLQFTLSLSTPSPLSCAGVFRLGLRRIIQLRKEVSEMKKCLKEMQLAEHNIDATESGLAYLQVNILFQNSHYMYGGTSLIQTSLGHNLISEVS